MNPLAALMALVALILTSFAARAGDTAQMNVIGFTADGRVFVFEEFGVQDGSGFPYANRFYVDTETDRFLPRTPIRVRIDDERAGVDAARREARRQGQAIIADSVLERNRGDTVALNPVTELSADPFRVTVNPRPVVPPVDAPIEFRLEEIVFPPTSRCRDLGDVVGYRLTKVALRHGERTATVHEDRSIPSSRNCPLGYRIGAVQTFFPRNGRPVFVVLVIVRSFGFEGPDHRWISVPGRL